MNKVLMAKRFARSLKTYNDNAKIQKQMAEHLIGLLNKISFNNILEIGCGTGFLTKLATDNLKFTNYYANDIVGDCETYVKQINPNIIFKSGDMEEELNENIKYDLIISNASLQWAGNFKSYIIKLLGLLNTNGILLFSTFGKENFREIANIYGQTLTYYSVTEIKTMLYEYSPLIEEEIRIMKFKTPKNVLKHIQYTGVNSLEETFWTKKDLSDFEKAYNNICSGSPTLTYNPVYIKIQKN